MFHIFVNYFSLYIYSDIMSKTEGKLGDFELESGDGEICPNLLKIWEITRTFWRFGTSVCHIQMLKLLLISMHT